MQDSLDTLRQYSIVSHDEVKTLRQTILQNHPHLTDGERAQLFAKQLHQKLDEALALFDSSSQKRLKYDLLKQAVIKSVFSIEASSPILLKPSCHLSLFKVLSAKPWHYLCLFCICLLSLTALSWNHECSKRWQTLSNWVTIPINLPISMDLSAASNYLQTPLQYKKINLIFMEVGKSITPLLRMQQP